ncbi:MAG: NAD(P)-dependent oxidoreductase [Solirubrobacterales bacterium]|nr:NAD(P)-dependent oxidoreductase [Solirubrobacterales bacterium]
MADSGARVVVTGATGWLGSVTCDGLKEAGVSAQAYASRARDGFLAFDEMGPAPVGDGPLILLHFAFLTRDKLASLGQEAYVAANVEISSRMLDWIAKERPDAIFLASSGAAAAGRGIDDDPYGALKRLDELAFAQAARDVGARLRIARIYNVAGPHITTPELYAIGDLIGAALRGEPLRIRAGGDVIRSYVGVDDLVAVVLAELLAPDRPQYLMFDTAGQTVEIAELADAVRSALGREELAVERDRDPQASPSVYLGDAKIITELLHYHDLPTTSLAEQIRQTAESLK